MVVVFVLETIFGGSESPNTLINFGGMFNPLIVLKNQWFRLLTAQFVHIGFLHLASNAVMIYYAGSILEPLIGPKKFLSVFLLSGIGGNLLSLAFGSDYTVSAGASTALFGLFGVVIALALKMRGYQPLAYVGRQFLVLAIVNLALDLFMTHIDILGHLGGLLTGFLLGILIGGGVVKSSFNNKIRVLAAVALIIYVVFTIRVGLVIV